MISGPLETNSRTGRSADAVRTVRRKVCMLGATAVGKTSLVRRFVTGGFSPRYLTTVGVTIERRAVEIDGCRTDFVVWDLAGDDSFQALRTTYLRGAAGYVLVVDGTRPSTLEKARALQRLAQMSVGDVPFVIALNKADLTDDWRMTRNDIAALESEGWTVTSTSAKSGDAVDDIFLHLARQFPPGG